MNIIATIIMILIIGSFVIEKESVFYGWSIEDKDEQRRGFNSQFEVVEGIATASQVKALMSRINASNASFGFDNEIRTNEDKFVERVGLTSAKDISLNKKYIVKCMYNSSGYVSKVIITDNKIDNQKEIERLKQEGLTTEFIEKDTEITENANKPKKKINWERI